MGALYIQISKHLSAGGRAFGLDLNIALPIFPSYFEGFRKPKSTRFDHEGKVTKPFQILKGGYQIVFKNGKWSEITGSATKKEALAQEDRRGHRSEMRKIPLAKRRRSKA
jgi:hypothetical protein